LADGAVRDAWRELRIQRAQLTEATERSFDQAAHRLMLRQQVLAAFDPRTALQRGYSIVRKDGELVRSAKQVAPGDMITIQLSDLEISAEVKRI